MESTFSYLKQYRHFSKMSDKQINNTISHMRIIWDYTPELSKMRTDIMIEESIRLWVAQLN